MVQKFFRNKNI